MQIRTKMKQYYMPVIMAVVPPWTITHVGKDVGKLDTSFITDDTMKTAQPF